VTVAEVQRALACEFAYALEGTTGEGRRAVDNWGAFIELTLISKDLANITPGIGRFSSKVGNTTVATTATLPSMTFDGFVQDKNTIAYFVGVREHAADAACPPAHSELAASGLELADFIVGAAQVINSGGRIASSSSILTSAGLNPVAGAVITAGTVFPAAAVREVIPTIKYERVFTVSRKASGGLSFKVNDLELTLSGSNNGRERTNNMVTVTMGARSATITSADQADLDGRVADPGRISLEDSIFLHREDELNALRGVTPNEVIVVTPPAGP
jgi:hypothetical protein